MPTNNVVFRGVMSVSQLADEVLGMSRAHVYELIQRGALPMPCYDTRSRRPFYTEEQQRQIFEIRQSGIGSNGAPVVFYRRKQNATPMVTTPSRQPRSRRVVAPGQYAALTEQLKSLGVPSADELSVGNAVRICFPNGVQGVPEQDILRSVFRHLRSQNAA